MPGLPSSPRSSGTPCTGKPNCLNSSEDCAWATDSGGPATPKHPCSARGTSSPRIASPRWGREWWSCACLRERRQFPGTMSILSRRGHEALQEWIVFGSTALSVVTFYFLFRTLKAPATGGAWRLRCRGHVVGLHPHPRACCICCHLIDLQTSGGYGLRTSCASPRRPKLQCRRRQHNRPHHQRQRRCNDETSGGA